MLTDLDRELFPDDCEVVEISSHDLFAYKIFKNGSSTLQQEAEIKNYKIWRNQDLKNLDRIDIFVRDPRDRFNAGVEMYCSLLHRDNPSLCQDDIVWFTLKYIFLNRHYTMQFHWLLNLVRFTHPGCRFRFHDFQEFGNLTTRNDKIFRKSLNPDQQQKIHDRSQDLELWFLLDRILMGLVGQELIWSEVLKIYKNHPARPLDIIMYPLKDLIDVLR